MAVSVEVQIDTNRLLNTLNNNDEFWKFAANEWHRLYTPWVPFDSGLLAQNVTITPKQIQHNQIYGNYIYHGTSFKFKKDKHPLASAKWDEVARPTQESKLVNSMQNYINSGRLPL